MCAMRGRYYLMKSRVSSGTCIPDIQVDTVDATGDLPRVEVNRRTVWEDRSRGYDEESTSGGPNEEGVR